MRDVGKHFTVNAMLAKESVKRRIESEDGITYTEFSYLAAAGVRLSRAVRSIQLHAADGRQRSVGQHHRRDGSDSSRSRRQGARPRDAAALRRPPARSSARPRRARSGSIRSSTSPFEFYQFWLNTDDSDAVTVSAVLHVSRSADDRAARGGDATRARIARGTASTGARGDAAGPWRRARRARRTRIAAFCSAKTFRRCQPMTCLPVFDDVPSSTVTPDRLTGEGVAVVELLASSGLTTSKGEATRLDSRRRRST